MPSKKKKTLKPKVGFFGITGCAGCLLSVIFNEEDLLPILSNIDLVAFPFIKGDNPESRLDIAFIEGTVVSNNDLETIRGIRRRSKVVVALGTCACDGNIPCIRNFTGMSEFDRLRFDKVEKNMDVDRPSPVSGFIPVDFTIPGCPPDREEIKTFIRDILIGKDFRNYKGAVCIECRFNEVRCLLDDCNICLGPITNGGCGAVCPQKGLRCYGCRGLNDDANFEEYFRLMRQKGHDIREVKKMMETFMALSVNRRIKGTEWEKYH